MALVGVIANPAAGKDIRRLVAQGRTVPNQEKVNVIRRVLAGLEAVGVERVAIMPDITALGQGALEGFRSSLKAEVLDVPLLNSAEDSTRAAALMVGMGAACLVTVGGDGTNRAVAKGCGTIPLVPISTGTNNVFPFMVEGTVAGLAAGVVARGLVDVEKVTAASKRLEVFLDGRLHEVALVDVAISKERFVAARAIWDMATIYEVFLTHAEPFSIGLSSIGAQLRSLSVSDEGGIYFRLGSGGVRVVAPVAPGVVEAVDIVEWRRMSEGERVPVELRPCTVALDGEREFSVQAGQRLGVAVSREGPRVVQVQETLRYAASQGIFLVPDV